MKQQRKQENTENTYAECFALASIPKSIMAGRYAYLTLGVSLGVWAALIPFAMERLQVNEAQLGLLLLSLGFGATLSMPVSGALTNKFGCRALQSVGIPLCFIALFLLSFVPTPLSLALCLGIFGAMNGILDVAMNLQVALLEQACKRRLMSNMHAMYVIGVAFGSASMAQLLLCLGNHIIATGILCVLVLGALVYFQAYFFPKTSCNEEKTPLFNVSKGIIFWFGLICFFLFALFLSWLLCVQYCAHAFFADNKKCCGKPKFQYRLCDYARLFGLACRSCHYGLCCP